MQPTRALLCLLILQPTIRSDMYSDTTNESLLCSSLSRDFTTNYLIYRLSALICVVILQPTRYGALPCLAILQPTIWRSTLSGHDSSHYLLYSACQYVSRLVGVPSQRLVGTLVGGLVGVLGVG
jgi:hypothetical protein